MRSCSAVIDTCGSTMVSASRAARSASTAFQGFWSYAKERLIKHHGVSPRYFPFHLKEMEFRYNHRTASIFDALVDSLCQPVAVL